MVKVDAFTISGIELFFHSSDHKPEHFHARFRAKWEIRVYIQQTDLDQGLVFNYKSPRNFGKKFRGLSNEHRSELFSKVMQYKDELLIEWNNKVCSTELV